MEDDSSTNIIFNLVLTKDHEVRVEQCISILAGEGTNTDWTTGLEH